MFNLFPPAQTSDWVKEDKMRMESIFLLKKCSYAWPQFRWGSHGKGAEVVYSKGAFPLKLICCYIFFRRKKGAHLFLYQSE